jgi:RNA polymerase sigma factor (sigma-70 family)
MRDGETIGRYLAGDKVAYGTLDSWLRQALGSFRRRVGDGVEDIVGECHLELFQRLGKGEFRSESGLKTYVWRVAQNRAISFVRLQGDWEFLELDRVAASLLSPRRSSDSAVMDRDLAQSILAVMPERCRRLWMLVAWGFSYQEMAESLSEKEGTLRVQVRRCRARLDRLIEEEGINFFPPECNENGPQTPIK